MDYILSARGLCKEYKSCKALSDFTINVPKGSIYGLVGRNGAGKTTFIRLVCGLQEATKGSFRLYGTSSDSPNISKARRRLGAIIETPSIYLDMSAKENLMMQYKILGLPSYEGIDGLLELVGLSDTGRRKAKNFSLGMRQRLAIAVALCGDPDFLILDEPMNGLDPQGIIEIRELILKLNRERQVTILISSHILDELARTATHYGFVDKGRTVKEISARELQNIQRKCLQVTVDNTKTFSEAMDLIDIEYEITSESTANIYGKCSVTEIVLALYKNKCNVLTIKESDESLESYFINLVGGEGK